MNFFIVRSGALEDVVVEASGATHAAVKAVLKYRPAVLGPFVSVRPSGCYANGPGDLATPTAIVLTQAAASGWYHAGPGGGFGYAGAPGR